MATKPALSSYVGRPWNRSGLIVRNRPRCVRQKVLADTSAELLGRSAITAAKVGKQLGMPMYICTARPILREFESSHDLTGWFWTGLIERIRPDQRSWR